MRKLLTARKLVFGLLLLMVLAAACGQKTSVKPSAESPGAQQTEGSLGPDGGVSPTEGATSGSQGPTTGTGTGGGGGTVRPTSGSTGGGTGGPIAGIRTGVTATEIVIGLHAPLTGAAPLPQDTFESGKGVYWDWLDDHGKIFGRKVRVEFVDDKYKPSDAQLGCKSLVEGKKVFLLVGAAGADQIQACAQYAASVGVPYMSMGVMETGLKGLKTYFAASMSYPQQSVLMAQYIMKRLDGAKKKIAMVRPDTSNFDDAHVAFVDAMKSYGVTLTRDSTVPKDADDTALLNEAIALKRAGVEIVYWLPAPVVWIHMLGAASSQAYHPLWVAPGVTIGVNAAADLACKADPLVKANAFTPYMNLDVIDKFDANFNPAYKKYAGSDPDDIGIALWGLGKVLHQAFLRVGSAQNLTRENFIATLERATDLKSNVFPTLNYTPSNHFGAREVHLLDINCSNGQWKTLETFKSGF
ncbi:MAG: ABC transporter substrate-binding protein [Actinomycetota bacterium]